MFDTQALLILYYDERGAQRVEELLKKVMDKKITGYMSVINLAELYYILSRKNKKIAEEKEKNIRNFGIKIVPIKDDVLWKEAAILKTNHSLSLADAFAAATAKILKSQLIVANPDFDNIEGIQLERIK